MGEQQCLLKLACLSGKHAASVSGATTATMLLTTTYSFMPDSLKEPYQALRDSMMYSDDCSQYACGRSTADEEGEL